MGHMGDETFGRWDVWAMGRLGDQHLGDGTFERFHLGDETFRRQDVRATGHLDYETLGRCGIYVGNV